VQNPANEHEPPCVLIIDEINRANLSRVFGELMYLLESRDKAIPLAGEQNPFAIPQNVYVIGTMNTADRSIALVDHALRRRFSFIHLATDYDVLRSHLEKHSLDADSLIKALRAVNAAIDNRNYEVGISFFLKDGAALQANLKDIWEGEIEPYLEEYFYDQLPKLEPLRWKNLSASLLAPWKMVQ
jgi:5-methylcytosine-specific restriction protein B